MRPAFSSTKQAAAFGLLLLFCLLSPVLLGKRFLPPREQAYASAGWDWGPYPWIRSQIFEETNDIDILFIGSSHLLWGIDTPYVEQQLDAKLGRQTVVRSVCWGGAGFDSLYFITKDLLAHRRVHMLVFYDERLGTHVNPKAPKWFRYGEDREAISGLPLKDWGIFYFAAVIGMPGDLLESALPNLAEDTNGQPHHYFETHYQAPNPATRLGSVRAEIGFDPLLGANRNFVPVPLNAGATPADVSIYDSETATNFFFANQPWPEWQTHFARNFGSLAARYGCHLVLVHPPTLAEVSDTQVVESRYWPDFLHTDVAMVGIPGRLFFGGFTNYEEFELYGDWGHLNATGQTYYTTLITPALLQLYGNPPTH